MKTIQFGLGLLRLKSPCIHKAMNLPCAHKHLDISHTYNELKRRQQCNKICIQILEQKISKTNNQKEKHILFLNRDLYKQTIKLTKRLNQFLEYLQNHCKDVKRCYCFLSFTMFLKNLEDSMQRPASFKEVTSNLISLYKKGFSEQLKTENFQHYMMFFSKSLKEVISEAIQGYDFIITLEENPKIITNREVYPANQESRID